MDPIVCINETGSLMLHLLGAGDYYGRKGGKTESLTETEKIGIIF